MTNRFNSYQDLAMYEHGYDYIDPVEVSDRVVYYHVKDAAEYGDNICEISALVHYTIWSDGSHSLKGLIILDVEPDDSTKPASDLYKIRDALKAALEKNDTGYHWEFIDKEKGFDL